MKLETAQEITAIINKLLTGADVYHVAIFVNEWPRVNIGSFDKAYTVDYKDGRGSVGLSAASYTMTGSEAWNVDTQNRTLSAKTINGYGQLCVFGWTDMRPRDDTWDAWCDAERAMPYIPVKEATMVIEFSAKYHVEHECNRTFTVTVPRDDLPALKSLLEKQPWVFNVYQNPWPSLLVQTSPAYEITTEQAIDALSKLCEHVMAQSPVKEIKRPTIRLNPRQVEPLTNQITWYRSDEDLPTTSGFVLNEYGHKVCRQSGKWLALGADGGYYETGAPVLWCYVPYPPE